MSYAIKYAPETLEHIRLLTHRQQMIVLDTVERQLTYQPTIRTRNRKPMRSNLLATWELRIDDLRVYYEVEEKPIPTVFIRAIGIKERNTVRIGGEIIKL